MSLSPSTPTSVMIALVQARAEPDRAANLNKAIGRISDAAASGASIVCLQELFTSLYPCQSEDHRNFDSAETIPGPISEGLSRAAAEHGVVVIGSLFERRAAGVYHNTAIVFDADGSMAGSYRKMHIPDDPFYYEKFYFTPGDLGFRCFDTRFGRLGVGICWDQWFPEAARLWALAGAQILFFPTAIGWIGGEKDEFGESQHSAWETMLRSHAIANGLFVAATNRVGGEDNIEFWGASMAVDPNGNLLARASHDREETLLVECHLPQIDLVRTDWPFLRDRRIDAYGDLMRRYRD